MNGFDELLAIRKEVSKNCRRANDLSGVAVALAIISIAISIVNLMLRLGLL